MVKGQFSRWSLVWCFLGAAMCPHSSHLQRTVLTTLVRDMATTIGTDGFLLGVLESVKDSDDNFFENFFLDVNKVLCCQRAEDVRTRVCVPAHGDRILAGHPGIDCTYAAVAYAYYWPNLAADIPHFVRSCAVCTTAKSLNQLRMGTDTFSAIPLLPFTSWAINLVGPLPPTKKGHTWIVTWVDRTSKMIVAAAAANGQMTSEKLSS